MKSTKTNLKKHHNKNSKTLKKKKRKTLCVIIVIHSAMCVGEQWFLHTFYFLLLYKI